MPESAMSWLAPNALQAVESVGIIASLIFTAVSLRIALRAQRITNLFQLTLYQREVWGGLAEKPELRRILKPDLDLAAEPMTESERRFLTSAILHLSLAYEAQRYKAINPIDGMEKDAKAFFSLPLPRERWRELKNVQNAEFVRFVDRLLMDHESTRGLKKF